MSGTPIVEERPPSFWALCRGATARDRRNNRRLNAWLFAWAVAFVGATWALVEWPERLGALGWLVAVVPTVLGVAALLAYVRFLRQADELLRRISLEGLALGFGCGWLFMTGWRLLEHAGAPKLDVDDGLLVMIVAFVAGQWLGWKRYQ